MTLVWVALVVSIGCSDVGSQQKGNENIPSPQNAEFGAYWHQGKAEVARFALRQARYGELRDGNAIMIFVTEDFLRDKQVKLESDPTGKDAVPILKLNFTKEFNTGIYPYSMMTSVFTPVALDRYPNSLKVTTTSQEWCGHTFTQLNFKSNGYNVRNFSYFESEGDRDYSVDPALLEDEVWSRIRINPASLPTGDIRIIPGTMTARLRHTEAQVETANATISSIGMGASGTELVRYKLEYPKSERTLSIDFEKGFPHRIQGWSETYRDGFGPRAQVLTTTAVRTNELMIDYWRHNAIVDDSLRRQLGLP